jgi:hypothetical protein
MLVSLRLFPLVLNVMVLFCRILTSKVFSFHLLLKHGLQEHLSLHTHTHTHTHTHNSENSNSVCVFLWNCNSATSSHHLDVTTLKSAPLVSADDYFKCKVIPLMNTTVNNYGIFFWLVHVTVTAVCVFQAPQERVNSYFLINYNCRVTSFKNRKCAV